MRLGIPQTRPVSAAVVQGRRRLCVVAGCFALAFASLAVRLVDLTSAHDVQAAPPTVASGQTPDPRRSDIVDRNGELLATNLRVPSIYADPAEVPDIDRAARQLASVLPGTTVGELTRRLRASKRFAGSSTR
jgi:cell division protein FtsI (penicillin-binding protein 3)